MPDDDCFLQFLEINLPATCQLRSTSHLACEARDFTLNLSGLSFCSEVNISHERRERRGERSLTWHVATWQQSSPTLGGTGGDWSLQHNGDNANVGPTVPLGEIKTQVKYKPGLHYCGDRPCDTVIMQARECITKLQHYMITTITMITWLKFELLNLPEESSTLPGVK